MMSVAPLTRAGSTWASRRRLRTVWPALVLVVLVAAAWSVWARTGATARGAVSVAVSAVPVNGRSTVVLVTAGDEPLYINRIDMPFARGCVWLKVRCDPNWVPLTISKAEKLRVRGLPTQASFVAMVSMGAQCLLEFHGHILYARAARAADYPDSVGADWTIATPSIYPYSWEAIAAPVYVNANCPA